MDASRLNTLEKTERNLVSERHQLVLRMLKLALADVTHHLQLVENRNRLTAADIEQLSQFHKHIL